MTYQMRTYRIGMLIGNKSGDYLRAIRLGVQNTLEEAGHTLVNVCDLIPSHHDENTSVYLRVAFEVASRLDLDAIVVPLGSVHNYLGSGAWEETLEMLELLAPERTVLVEREVKGYRCITKDNVPGMRDCMRHLLETCGLTRIAFVSGPADSNGAQEREGVYFEEMAAHGLPVPVGYFVRGAFSGDCYEVIDQLVAGHPELEAIACAADQIAFTAYRVMHDRHLVVGRDIAITGFDDQMGAVHLDPPLTTVHLTGYDLGLAAGREALRLCQGLPALERRLSGRLVARSSCGERGNDKLMSSRHLIRQRPFPADEITRMMVDSTLSMAGPSVLAAFTKAMGSFVGKMQAIYQDHLADPDKTTVLFESQDLAELFGDEFQGYVSLEGFHAATMNLLEALLAESPEQEVGWVLDQISYLHLRIARLLYAAMHASTRALSAREWLSFHVVDDALAADTQVDVAYRAMMDKLRQLGARKAGLYLLPDPVTVTGGKSIALSDTLLPIATLEGDQVSVPEGPTQTSLQDLVPYVLERYGKLTCLTVAGVMAGNELLGVLAMDPGTLDDAGQLMAVLNLGVALKHLQMIDAAHEMNELLSKNNLVLELQSQRDEMTGLYNRRGLNNGMQLALREHPQDLAVLMYLDLDGLKTINDTLGHDAGDEAIKATARVLAESLPPTCLICRMGGDEFVVFAQVASHEEATGLADGIQRGVERHNADPTAGVRLSVSCGMECFCSLTNPEEDVRRAMAVADERMYEQKRHRRASRRFSG